MSAARHPIQPIVQAEGDIPRFKPNALVVFMQRELGAQWWRKLRDQDFSAEDWEQLEQLLGCSLRRFRELSFVSEETLAAVEKASAGEDPTLEREKVAADMLTDLRAQLAGPMALLFGLHPDVFEKE